MFSITCARPTCNHRMQNLPGWTMAHIYDLQVSAVYDRLERIDRNLFSGRKSRGCFGFRTKSYPFRPINRCSAVAKIDVFLRLNYVNPHCRRCVPGGVWGGGFDCGSNKANPPQPASTVSFLPEQERYPPEELHPQLPQRVSFSTQKAPQTTLTFSRR